MKIERYTYCLNFRIELENNYSSVFICLIYGQKMKILLVIILMTILIEVEGRRCHSCHKFYKHHTCPQLEHTNCEIVRRECGCCNACALNRGDKCNSKKPR